MVFLAKKTNNPLMKQQSVDIVKLMNDINFEPNSMKK